MSRADVLLLLSFLRRLVVHGAEQDELFALISRLEAAAGVKAVG